MAVLVQVPPLLQMDPPPGPSWLATAQKSTCELHVSPLYFSGHVHEKTPRATDGSLEESLQVPPFMHGALEHSSKSVSQSSPTQPATQ